MKDIIFDDFQNSVNDSLLRHKSILDLITKYSESCSRVNRAIAKSVTNCGCLTIDDDIFKITLCDLSGASNNSNKVLNPLFGDEFMVVVAGEIWLDIMNKNVNKGAALEKIQNDENISYEETMVFGDFYNDIEMLGKAKFSFVMENANEDMKQYGNYIAKSNRDYGVIKAIEEYVLK